MFPLPVPPVFRALCVPLALAATVQGTDPFAAGRRWSRAPGAGEAWIPRSVAFAGPELVWSGAGGTDPELALCASASADARGTVLQLDTHGLDGLVGSPLVAAGDEPSELFALVQLAPGGAAVRRSVVRAYDSRAAAQGRPFAPRWEHELLPPGNGPALLAANPAGTALAAAAFDADRRRIALEWLAPERGEVRLRRELAADGLRVLALSSDGARLALGAGSTVHWLAADGGVLAAHVLGAATAAVALSGDGAWLAHGAPDGVELWHDVRGATELAGRYAGLTHELAAAAALSSTGETLAVAWWDAGDGASVRLELIDTRAGARTVVHEQRARPGAPQNFPGALALTPDGRRVALGLWGQQDERPEAVLLERGRTSPLLALDLPGSVDALALDEQGTRLAVARRAAHAGAFTRSGALELFETGERTLVLRAAARPQGELALAQRVPADASLVRFALGIPRSRPLGLRAGELGLQPPWKFFGGVRVGSERVDATLSLPGDPAWIAVPVAAQAAWVEAGALHLGPVLRFELL